MVARLKLRLHLDSKWKFFCEILLVSNANHYKSVTSQSRGIILINI